VCGVRIAAGAVQAAGGKGRLGEAPPVAGEVEGPDGPVLFEQSFDVVGDDEDGDDSDGSDDDEDGELPGEEEDEPEDYDPTLTTGGVAWGESALRVAQSVLAEPPCAPPAAVPERGASHAPLSFAGVLELYSFRVHAAAGRIVLRLDKPSDRCVAGLRARDAGCGLARLTSRSSVGSPTMDELGMFSVAFDTALDAAAMSPDELTVEVSSAGAERELRPRDLQRFVGFPMRVVYLDAHAAEQSELLELMSVDEGLDGAATSTWRVADVKANRAHLKKGQPLNKKVKERRLVLHAAALVRANLHVDA